MDRVLGVLSIVIVGTVALAAARDTERAPGIAVTLLFAAAACAVAALIVFNPRVAAALQALALRLPSAAVRRLTCGLAESVRRYAGHRGALINTLFLSVLVQIIRVIQAYCLGRALGIAVPLAVYFAFVPIILLIMLLPVTINGLGTSQAAFYWLFGREGVSEPQAVALSVLFVALGVVGNLPGGLLYAWKAGTPGNVPVS